MEPAFSITEAENYMNEALKEASLALNEGEVPVGCVIVSPEGTVIARSRNTRENSLSIHGHAEITAINKAASVLGTLSLSGCSLFVTLEPCPMCLGAIAAANVSALYFGAPATYCEGFQSGFRIPYGACSFHVFRGICEEKCTDIIKEFFQMMRQSN